MTAASVVLEKHERREARDSWRASGGSQRRPLHSFRTEAEKRQAREHHAAELASALAQLQDLRGFEVFCESALLNPHLTAGNAALAAFRCPGEVVGSRAWWVKQGGQVRKGETAALRLTGRNFWPTAAWCADQVGAEFEGLEVEPLDPRQLEAMHRGFVDAVSGGERPIEAARAVVEFLREVV